MTINPYKILGISRNASYETIKSSYRSLVKKHHPDKGGNATMILQLNAAWEILKNKAKVEQFNAVQSHINQTEERNKSSRYSHISKTHQKESIEKDEFIKHWVKFVYIPIDRLILEVIKPFSQKIKELSADPYDDDLMETFCIYIEKSKKKLKKIHEIFESLPTPLSAKNFGLNLYHCFSEVEDAINEFDIYTQGYVDSYLHDGQQMLKEAKKKRMYLQQEKRNLPI